jgi:hypothetical protein
MSRRWKLMLHPDQTDRAAPRAAGSDGRAVSAPSLEILEIWRYPVKSMGGERLDTAMIEARWRDRR